MFHTVVTEQFEVGAAPDSPPFATVMTWQVYDRSNSEARFTVTKMWNSTSVVYPFSLNVCLVSASGRDEVAAVNGVSPATLTIIEKVCGASRRSAVRLAQPGG